MAATDLIKSLFARRLTHTGIVRGADCRTPDGYRREVKLKWKGLLCIAENGRAYHSRDGYPLTYDWPLYKLDIDSVRPLETSPGVLRRLLSAVAGYLQTPVIHRR